MVPSTLHNHCTLCDGKSTPEEMVQAAIAAGFTDFGFSCHSWAPFDPEYSIRDEAAYIAQIRALQTKYAGQICIFCGLEQDHFAPVQERGALDYIIGSVHYVQDPATGERIPIDGTPEDLQRAADAIFGGDMLALVSEYYRLVTQTVQTYRPEVIGHFDVIVKNNRNGRFFDETAPEYRRAALDALEACAACGGVFEVNTGGMAKGHRAQPYPATFLLERLRELDAPVMLNTDCHDAAKLCLGLEEAAALLRRVGFQSVQVWQDGAFREMTL